MQQGRTLVPTYDRTVLGAGLALGVLSGALAQWWTHDPKALLLDGLAILTLFFASTLAYPPARKASMLESSKQLAAFAGVWLLFSAVLLALIVFPGGRFHGDIAGGFVRMTGWMLVPCAVFLVFLYLIELSLKKLGERIS